MPLAPLLLHQQADPGRPGRRLLASPLLPPETSTERRGCPGSCEGAANAHVPIVPPVRNQVSRRLKATKWVEEVWRKPHYCVVCTRSDELGALSSNGQGLYHGSTFRSTGVYRNRNACAACANDICQTHTAGPPAAYRNAHTLCVSCYTESPRYTACGVSGRNAACLEVF